MYEEYFGLSASPFQIHPDPGFYFESKGHGSTYQYLRFGAFQGEGFIVVTGEIGAGKTTLLRALLEELDPARVVAAQIVSTQLGADDLLSAVALAFGLSAEGLGKAKLLVTLEAFLATLATSRRRALLIVDEAQNLSAESIEELRMLSNFQFGNQALLQSFLVGQPELREMLRQPRMEQLRQRVLASCHLGPMEATETRGYIEHRLRHVGWQQRPSFDNRAFELIHEASGGVPRRINMLCNRLLLSAFLDEVQHIDCERVRRVEREMRAEVSGASLQQSRSANPDAAPLLCVSGSTQGLWGLAALQRAFAQREDLPPVRILRVVGQDAIRDDAQAASDLRTLGVDDPGMAVLLEPGTPAQRAAQVTQALAAQMLLQEPAALIIADDGMVELLAAVAALGDRRLLVRIDVGHSGGAGARRRRSMLECASTLAFTADEATRERLIAQGAAADSVQAVGNIAVDVARLALGASAGTDALFRREGLAASLLMDPAGYVVVAPRDAEHGALGETLVDLDLLLRGLGWRVPLICPVPAPLQAPLAQACAQAMATDLRIIRAPALPERLGLLRRARCVVTDDAWLRAQAIALGMPCLDLPVAVPSAQQRRGIRKDLSRLARDLSDIIAAASRGVQAPALYDGRACDRIAAGLSDWLLGHQDPDYRRFLQQA